MKITTELELITVDRAKQLLATNKKNRPLNETNLNKITRDMKRGDFQITGESIKIAENGNLIDGQHRLMAIVQTGKPQRMMVTKGLPNDAFKYIDTGRTRKAADVLAIEGFKNTVQLSAAVSMIIGYDRGALKSGKNRRGMLSNSDISTFVQKHSGALRESMPHGLKQKTRIISPAVLAGFHYILKRINSDQADDFVWKIASGEDLKTNDAVYLFRQKMLNNVRSNKKMQRVEIQALLIKAWNYYRKGIRISRLEYAIKKESFPKAV